jgi:dTDP-4-dehydrorhamnose reductase
MKILITGSNGQLGNEIRELAGHYPQYQFMFTDVGELDITRGDAVQELFASFRPDTLINCAAYTAVDKAETDREMAFRINADAAEILAKACSKFNCLLVHISTDYVFDGLTWIPQKEDSPTHPVSAYAQSKFEGENRILANASRALIIRTSWLYSASGNNFVKTILKYGAERGKLNVVFDQTGTPTYARDLADTILQIIPLTQDISGTHIYHYSNEGVCSWYDFAISIIRKSGIDCRISPIETKDYPLPAVRPFYSVLNKEKIKNDFSIQIPHWEESLTDCLKRLGFPTKNV